MKSSRFFMAFLGAVTMLATTRGLPAQDSKATPPAPPKASPLPQSAPARVVVVGANGEPREVQVFYGAENEGTQPILQWLQQQGTDELVTFSPPKFVIGVAVTEVPAVVWSQLKQPSLTGVVVVKVMEDAPAIAAGLEENDIILTANDEEISDQRALVDAIEKSGESPMKFLILRGGEQQTITITPRVNEAAVWATPGTVDPAVKKLLEKMPVHSFGPGVLFKESPDASTSDAVKQELEAMRLQLEELQKSVDELKSR